MSIGTARSGRRNGPLRAHVAVLFWVLVALVVAIAHQFIPQANWLMVHSLALGVATNAILIWSSHFTTTLMRTAGRDLVWPQMTLLNAGIVAVVVGKLMDRWSVMLAGAIAVGIAVIVHAAALRARALTSLGSRFGSITAFYVAAAFFLPVGAGIGVWMGRGLLEPAQSQAVIAHALTNIMGWVGITVLGTTLTLVPTIVRTRMHEAASRVARRGLPVLVTGLALSIAGALSGLRLPFLLGLVVLTAATCYLLMPSLRVLQGKPPASFAGWSAAMALVWLAGTLVAFILMAATARSWPQIADRLGWLVAPFLVGFIGQILIGALSFLLPVLLRGGPHAIRQMNDAFDKGTGWRVAVLNLALLGFAVPAPSLLRVVLSSLGLLALIAFVWVSAVALIRRWRKADDAHPELDHTSHRRSHAGAGLAGLAVTVLAVASAVAIEPTMLGDIQSVADGATATGHTTQVQVSAKDMRFTPDSVTVPRGDRLIIKVTNDDAAMVHDLVLETGHTTSRLNPGEAGSITIDVVGKNVDGWCSVIGHRQMGMVFSVIVPGDDSAVTASDSGSGHGSHGTSTPTGPSSNGLLPYDAALPPAPGTTTHKVTMRVTEQVMEVAPGKEQLLWTYEASMPGPTLRGKVGDTFEITLVNDGTMGHSVDFHAGDVAPDKPMRTIAPGESLVYNFVAKRSGIWLYHCATMPMSLHIANGLFGAVIIDPPDLDPVDKEFLLIQSELYLGKQGQPADPDKIATMDPDLVVFNGYADQYTSAPLQAGVGETVRFWVLNAGPNHALAFHIVGAQFDTFYKEGAYLLRKGQTTGGAQVLDLVAAQGGFVEATFVEAGNYPIVNHIMSFAERGAHGIITIS